MAVVLLLFVAVSPAANAEPGAEKWTFMVYACADCDLEGYQLGNMLQMADIGSTGDVDIVVQMDRIAGHTAFYGDWTDCKRFHVSQGMTPTSENALASLGEVSMGDPTVFADFLVWAIQDYPADRYFVMIMGHGWIDGTCWDWTNDDLLTSLEMRWALSHAQNLTGVHVDVIGFESCYQAALEIAYEIGDYADIIIASEELCTGWSYGLFLADLVEAHGTMNATALATNIVNYYSQYAVLTGGEMMTLSAFNLSRMEGTVASAIDTLADQLLANITRHAHAIAEAAAHAESHYPPWSIQCATCRDLADFAAEITIGIPDPTIQLAAQDLLTTIDDACIAEWHGPGHPDFHGLYLYLPATEEVYNARTSIYGQPYTTAHSLWTQHTSWDELLFHLFRTCALGLRSREQIMDSTFTSLDSNNDSYLDAVHITLNVSTDGDPIDVTAQGYLIDPLGTLVDQGSCTWTVTDTGGLGDLYLQMPSGGVAGLHSVRVTVYDEHGVFEDEIVLPQAAFLPEEMQHALSAHSITLQKTVVGQGYPAKVTVTVCNDGHYQETVTVTTLANAIALNVTELVVPVGGDVTFTVHWDTTGYSMGNYTVSVAVEPVDHEANTTDNVLECDRDVCLSLPGDVDADYDVDIFDIVQLAAAYGASAGQPQFDSNCDVNGDDTIGIFDVVIAALRYGLST